MNKGIILFNDETYLNRNTATNTVYQNTIQPNFI